ncbi:MAG: riboflavin synthase [Tepidisphaeraceae bacterium]
MFTGIIQQTARVTGVRDTPSGKRIELAVKWDDLREGQSVAVNGVCLTVAQITPGTAAFDVVPETLEKTNLAALKMGDDAHVERSLRVGDAIDGHFVLGHVDGTIAIVKQTADRGEWRVTLEAPPQVMKYVMPKGSVCLDGISLTVASIEGNQFDVALIPTTLNLTLLARRPVGWACNFEADILTKTVVQFLERIQ